MRAIFGLEPSDQAAAGADEVLEVGATGGAAGTDSDVPGGRTVVFRGAAAVVVTVVDTVVADSMVSIDVVHVVTVGPAPTESADWLLVGD